MKVYDRKSKCYGCSACFNICPSQAITMKSDKEGFLYPAVNPDLCSGCLKCRAVCPIPTASQQDTAYEQRVFAVKHKDEEIRNHSTSGGMFTALSDYILGMGGVVYGVILDDTLKVRHVRAVTKEERDRMRGSKYVQSDMGSTYQSVKKDLEAGKQVLFTGTPCQVEGLKSFLKRTDAAQLILCDIICHGVPSDLIWKEYVMLSEKKRHSHLKLHEFRTKQNGWRGPSRNVFINGEDFESLLSQLYVHLFYQDLALRPCCYSCRFSSLQRVSDITIGDFWGIKRIYPEFDDNKGVSLVLINTFRGYSVFQTIQEKLEFKESNKTDCLQGNLIMPTPLPKERQLFWNAYFKHGFVYVVRKFAGYTRYNVLINNLKKRIKKLRIYHYLREHLHPGRRN